MRVRQRQSSATKGDRAYFASEESAIRIICPNPEKVWSVSGAEPVFIPDRKSVV